MVDKKMYYIQVYSSWSSLTDSGFKWSLFSYTGLVMARSDFYRRRCDATRVGKRVARKLGISFKVEEDTKVGD